MALNFILLFFTALLAGLLVFVALTFKEKYFKLLLVFAGSYLFSITILHIIPELFAGAYDTAYELALGPGGDERPVATVRRRDHAA